MPEPATGRDLARQALAQYKASTWAVPSAKPPKKSVRRARRPGESRDPVGLGSVFQGLSDAPDWSAALQGGSVMDRWATLCPQFIDTVQPIAYDPNTGRLDLRPVSHAYAANLRLLGGQLCKQINDKLGKPVVKAIRVLPVGAITPPNAPQAAQETPQDVGPVITRDTASPGYHRTLEAHQEHRATPDRTANPYVAAAVDRQNQALRDRREPETAFTDAVAAHDQLTATEPAGSLEASLRAARARAAADRAGREPVRLFGAA